MLNPGGRSIKFDEFNASAVFNPSSYYSYTPLTAAEVRTIIPIYAGADKVNFTSNCGGAVFPLQLLSFNVEISQNNKEVKATWHTLNEVNAKGFDVERSPNGVDFKAVGFVAAKNVSAATTYSFVDLNAVEGTCYYRLKQIDNDGKFTYSSIVKVESKKSLRLSIYPNPSSSTITITHSKAINAGFVKISTVEGRLISTFKVAQGASRTIVDVSKLVTGNYLLVFDNGSEKQTTKFIKN